MTQKSIRREVDRQLEGMREGAVELYGEDELRQRLEQALGESRPLRVKLGMDPSAPDLHLGHTIVLQKLRRLQELGHQPIFLVGDFTAANSSLDLRRLSAVRFVFDQVHAGEVAIDQIGFSDLAPGFLGARVDGR